jgi:hypothetical protein
MHLPPRPLPPIAALLCLLLAAGPACATDMVPHRAVYELDLARADQGASVAQVKGRYVYDVKGSACAGYTLETRLVTEIVDREGKATLSDMHTLSKEDAGSRTMRFSSSQRLNNGQPEMVGGEAVRAGREELAVRLDKPQLGDFALAGKIMFPVQHSRAVLAAAAEGKPRLTTDYFDGSEKGNKVYATAAAIGHQAQTPVTGDGGAALDGLPSWPVTISYFELPGQGGEGLPAYELHLRLYQNGVSRALTIDYGAFALSGKLASLEIGKPAPCPK